MHIILAGGHFLVMQQSINRRSLVLPTPTVLPSHSQYLLEIFLRYNYKHVLDCRCAICLLIFRNCNELNITCPLFVPVRTIPTLSTVGKQGSFALTHLQSSHREFGRYFQFQLNCPINNQRSNRRPSRRATGTFDWIKSSMQVTAAGWEMHVETDQVAFIEHWLVSSSHSSHFTHSRSDKGFRP